MFGLEFLFGWGLLALPLAGLPVILHLLFRRKSPVVPFSTLRFIRASVQHTAARRRVQRWMLLACRVLLLLLLIWAISQPAKMLAANWFGGGRSTIAAIVVDTSYSMQLQDQQVTLLARASEIIDDLLRNQLRDAQVAIFKSQPAPKDQPERLESAGKIQSEWTGLKPQPAREPLANRVASAMNLLKRQDADHKWLVVVTDLQTHEFPQPLPEFQDGRVILIDLHPKEVRAAGVMRVGVDPDPPLAGIGSEAIVEVAGTQGNSQAVSASVTKTDGTQLSQSSPMMAGFESGGRTQLRFPLKLPAENWMLIKASLGTDDAMPWDNTRQRLVELPPRQIVTVIEPGNNLPAARFVRLALDPNEGKLPAWPLDVRRNTSLGGHENVAVVLLTQWPDAALAGRLRDFARNGGTVVLFLQPGLEESWAALPDATKSALSELLPGTPSAARMSGTYRATVGTAQDALTNGLTDEKFQLGAITVRRFVPFASLDGSITTVLNIVPATPTPGSKSQGLIFRRKIGSGTSYSISTLPDPRFTSLGTHPIFLPLLVRMSLRPPEQGAARNVEIGEPIILAGAQFNTLDELEIENPRKESFRLKPTQDAAGRRFVLNETVDPGLYTWRKPDEAAIVAMSNVQLPAAESDLDYRPADTVISPGPTVMVARSLDDLRSHMTTLSEPEPQWSPFIALVLLLICFEAMMGSVSKVWKGPTLRFFEPKIAAAGN